MKKVFPPTPDQTALSHRVSELQGELTGLFEKSSAVELADRTGSAHRPDLAIAGAFILPVWGQEIRLTYPTWQTFDLLSGVVLPTFTQALVLYYFLSADGAPVDQGWISFSELPDGRFYNQAYQGYTGGELWRSFKDNLQVLGEAALAIGGSPVPARPGLPGDRAWTFQALPRVRLMLAGWEGDEDFPASYQVLFDASAKHYLPTDVCALLGSSLTRRLITHRKNQENP